MLTDEQIEVLRRELAGLMDPAQACDLYYEYHSNESADPSVVLFHALGAWRVSPGFHDLQAISRTRKRIVKRNSVKKKARIEIRAPVNTQVRT
jgi:hypothetical protein